MKKCKIGLITLSDGREYLHQTQFELNMSYQNDICRALESTGYIEVVCLDHPIHSNAEAKEAGMALKNAGVEMTIFNYAIWCYPQFTAVATNFAPGPYILFCNLHPSECGMVGMLAAAGTLDQLGKKYTRIWGNINDNAVLSKVLSYIRAAVAVNRLKGNTYGNFGGRPIGMYTAVANLSQWQKTFGIDVENFEQYDIVRYGEKIDPDKLTRARLFLERHCKTVAYNNSNFTKEKLEDQIRSYYALRYICEEKGIDFLGIKAHGDLTDWYVTMDIAEAFLNDNYDWDGYHEPIVASTESDMDGALTMQIFKYITNTPVLFADVRHYEKSQDVWFFSNSGTSATYYAGRSNDIKENLKNVSLLPESKDYPAGGSSVHYFAHPGKITFARLARKLDEYYLTVVPAEIVQFDQKEMERLGSLATPQWPVAFTKLSASADNFLAEFPCNHIHGVYGDWIEEWKHVADILGIKINILE